MAETIYRDSPSKAYVCAFRGRRDDYQVPCALAEKGLLDSLLTDFFAGPMLASAAKILPQNWRAKILARHKPDLLARHIQQFPIMALREKLAERDYSEVLALRDAHDVKLSLAAAEKAKRNRSNLLLYSAYACDAFEMSYRHHPTKLLFQYHPHFVSEADILARDTAALGRSKTARQGDYERVVREQRIRSDNAWKHADHIICASGFTAQTLITEGANPNRISVIPYGVASLPAQSIEAQGNKSRRSNFRVLFVGSGIQRKGIHHLLRAWDMADLPRGSELVIVSRKYDPEYLDPKRLPEGVKLYQGTSAANLTELYASSSLFCMPSLVEGFGQVYLEALAGGLPVLGTPNTCLPDLGFESDGIFITEPGRSRDLANQLERLAKILPKDRDIRERARETARCQTWDKFRDAVANVCIGETASAAGFGQVRSTSLSNDSLHEARNGNA